MLGAGSVSCASAVDGCHGGTSSVAWDGQSIAMFHYVATLDHPYTVGCFRGAPRR